MKATRVIVLAVLLSLLALYWVSFVLFAEPAQTPLDPTKTNGDQNANSQHSKTEMSLNEYFPSDGVDILWLWQDPHARLIYSEYDDYLRKEADGIKSGHYLPEPSRARGLSHIRFALRSFYFNVPWVRQIVIVTPDASELPKVINATHEKIRVVKHSSIVPAELLPTYNWRSLLYYVHKIPNLSRLCIYFNEFDIATLPLKPSLFLSELGERSLFIEDPRAQSREDEDSAIMTATQRAILPDEPEALKIETRGPILLDKEILQEMATTYLEFIEENKKHRFRSKESIDPLMAHQLHIIKRGRKAMANVDVDSAVKQYETQGNGNLDEEELSQLAATIKMDTESFKRVILGESTNRDLTVKLILESETARHLIAKSLIPDKYRYQLVPSISEVVNPRDEILEYLNAKLGHWETISGAHPVIHFTIGLMVHRYSFVRSRLEYFLSNILPVGCSIEVDSLEFYNISLSLAIWCIVAFACWTFAVTRYFTSADAPHQNQR